MPSLRRIGRGAPLSALLLALALASCGTSTDRAFTGPAGNCGPAGCPDAGPGFGECTNGLKCNVHACTGGTTTRLLGRVFDPSGTAPVYNAIVYVPNRKPAEIVRGATCDRCAETVFDPVPRAVLTNENGEFSIDGVPDGDEVPLVFQIGKWRRQISVKVTACTDNRFDDPALMHLPRKQSEGDMPQIAVVTGGCDPLGCLFSRMGIDDSELTDAKGPGRIHVYKGFGGEGVVSGTATPEETDLWASPEQLAKYDMVMLACECKEHDELKNDAAKLAMMAYLDRGGRVFATHYHYTWLKNGPAPLASLADWGVSPASSLGTTYDIDQSFPKGAAMAQWLTNAGASTTPGTIDIKVPVEHLRGVKPGAQRWIYRGDGADEQVKFFSFNTPVGAPPEAQCGRGVLSDIHVSDGDGTGAPPNALMPASCVKEPLSARERALEFLMFDLSSCIQADELAPVPPR